MGFRGLEVGSVFESVGLIRTELKGVSGNIAT